MPAGVTAAADLPGPEPGDAGHELLRLTALLGLPGVAGLETMEQVAIAIGVSGDVIDDAGKQSEPTVFLRRSVLQEFKKLENDLPCMQKRAKRAGVDDTTVAECIELV